ncbi:MAG: glycosyltransferase [Burkholderiales bacterium]|nr:glycosyltransferase [Burkholderiales bacterium]
MPSMSRLDGGLPNSVVALSHHLGETGNAEVVLLSQMEDPRLAVPTNGLNFLTAINYVGKFGALTSLATISTLKKAAKLQAVSVIHNHGIWTATNHWASVRGRKSNLPVVIQPHGMLEAWSLEQKKIKKKSALWLYQKKDLESAALFIATSEHEYGSIRRLGLRQPIAIVPHGIDTRSLELEPIRRGGRRKIRTALFLSRIHPKKGLMDLLTVWAKITPRDWLLVIVGNSSDPAYSAEIKTVIKHLNLSSSVQLLGYKEGKEKDSLFRSSDLFVLPSYSENFGLVVLEALSYGLPVVTTCKTPWLDLEQKGCGWTVKPGAESLEGALYKAISLKDADLDLMSNQARSYARGYAWRFSAEAMMNVYQWIKNMRAMPSNVFLD